MEGHIQKTLSWVLASVSVGDAVVGCVRKLAESRGLEVTGVLMAIMGGFCGGPDKDTQGVVGNDVRGAMASSCNSTTVLLQGENCRASTSFEGKYLLEGLISLESKRVFYRG